MSDNRCFRIRKLRPLLGLLGSLALAAFSGCAVLDTNALETGSLELATHSMMNPTGMGPIVDEHGQIIPNAGGGEFSPPTELEKMSLPTYRLAPPDVLLIQGVRLTPKAPYHIQTGDFLQVIVSNALPDQPIGGPFSVSADGTMNLGPAYDAVAVVGLTIDEAQSAIAKHLSRIVAQPQVSVSLLQASGVQQIFGEHLIGPDGTVNLGIYGTVFVSGMTVNEARTAMEKHLSSYLDEPKISVDVLIYNSQYYYIVTEGGGFGDNLVRLPITGNETVLDALSQVGGLTQISSKKIWISRPAPKDAACDQILPVDWVAITKGAATGTNYQILPKDRIFIAEDRFIAANSFINKVINPVERIFGFSLLGAQTIQFMQRFPRGVTF